MDRVAALQFFARVVESGSFSQAARELGVGQPAVSKQVAGLERRLGAKLLNRTSRGLRPTPAGVDFYAAATRLLSDLDEAESQVRDGQRRPIGRVRVAAPPLLTSMMIVPALPEFFGRFPDVAVEFVVSERYADLVQEGLDLAIRIGTLDNSGLVARRIGSMQVATVASVEYIALQGAPLRPSDLDRHELLTNRYLGATSDWYFKNDERKVLALTSGRFSSNSPADTHAAVLAGLGIAQSARSLFEIELQSGKVVEVLTDFIPDPFPIHLLHTSRRMPQRVCVVSDFIEQCLEKQPSLRLI